MIIIPSTGGRDSPIKLAFTQKVRNRPVISGVSAFSAGGSFAYSSIWFGKNCKSPMYCPCTSSSFFQAAINLQQWLIFIMKSLCTVKGIFVLNAPEHKPRGIIGDGVISSVLFTDRSIFNASTIAELPDANAGGATRQEEKGIWVLRLSVPVFGNSGQRPK